MSQKVVVLICFVFALIVLGMFVFAYLASTDDFSTSRSDIGEPAPSLTASTTISDETNSFIPDEIVMQKSFIAGIHYLEGVVVVPNDCYAVSEEVMVLESYPEQVVIALSIDQAECQTRVNEIPLQYELALAPDATFSISINETVVPVTFINQ